MSPFFRILFCYNFVGTVSSNPLDILLGVIILAADLNAGRIGLDRWVIPFVRKMTGKDHKTAEKISA